VQTGSVGIPGRGLPFSANVRTAGLLGARVSVSARLPDGRWHPLPDSPLLLKRVVAPAYGRRSRLHTWAKSRDLTRAPRGALQRAEITDIIIPVYRGRAETLACIDSVRTTIGDDARILVVDDATDDEKLAAALDALNADGRITLLRNSVNLGFVASVNRALSLHPTHDVVLLNSDTLVFDDWLSRLRAAAYRNSSVGTVTPLSNAGSIASYPYRHGAEVAPEYAAALHTLARATHPGISVEIPVGVGFCLYIRRDCLRFVGELDAAVFGKGYGEEVDFCLRARRRGWSQQLAADVYVYHAGGLSFGGRRAALLERSHRLLNLRYPGYDAFIASFQAQDPVQALRRRLDEHRLSAFQGRFILILTLALRGGVERFVAERCRDISARGLHPLILRPVSPEDVRHCELWTEALELPNLHFDVPGELDALRGLLRSLRIEAIEIQHFLHLDARLIDAVRSLPVPYDVFVHDYAWICPRVTLIDGSGRYCGEPAVEVCERCVRRNGSSLREKISVAALRARSSDWLRGARRVLAPSYDTVTRLRDHFPDLEVQVRPHAQPEVPAAPPPPLAGRESLRIALLGAIGDHKGYAVLLACARDARARGLPLEFVVIGYTCNDKPLLSTGKVFVTGRYSEAEATHLLRREQPDLVWLPSVWPETWCYTLDYALSGGLPVVAFDLGAIAERLRHAGAGECLPLSLTPRQINDYFLSRFQASASAAASHSVQSRRTSPRHEANIRIINPDDISMNKKESNMPTLQDTLEQGLSASVQLLPLPPGLYLFSVKAANSTLPRAGGELSLPAVHVGLGPGVPPETVEFVAGPHTHGAWLFAPGDLLVTKVKGAGATLVMTSVRAPGGDVLSIKVERLEARSEVTASPSAAAAVEMAHSASRPKDTGKSSADEPRGKPMLPVKIGVHVRSRGDMSFADTPWAGRVAPGLWIESFCIRPMEVLGAQDVEYKALTGSGFETPWLSEEKMCGTKGMAVPLVGFAVRLKPSGVIADYDCEYSGYFQSGVTVGPLRNGAPCRSTVANDPLEGIQVRLLKRSRVVEEGTTAKAVKQAKSPSRPRAASASAPTAPPSVSRTQPARRA
jgi:GT2 family glycosyltransferase